MNLDSSQDGLNTAEFFILVQKIRHQKLF